MGESGWFRNRIVAFCGSEWTGMWLRDSGVVLFSQLTAVAITTVLAILVARYLGPSDLGVFSGLFGLSQAFSLFISFGLGTWLLRELTSLGASRQRPLDDLARVSGRLVSGAMAYSLITGLILTLCTLGVAWIYKWSFDLAIVSAALTVYIMMLALCTGVETVFRARRKLSYIVIATACEKGLLLLMVMATFVWDAGMGGLAFSYVVAGIVRLAIVGSIAALSRDIIFQRPGLTNIRHVVTHSLPFALNMASLSLIPRLDVIAVAAISTVDAGFFALGDRAVSMALVIPSAATGALYPFLAKYQKGFGMTWLVTGLLAIIGGIFTIAGYVLMPSVIDILVSPEYLSAVPTFRMMLMVLPFVFASSGLVAGLYSHGKEKNVLAVTLLSTVLGTSGVLAGEFWWGSLGAASGYVMRQVVLLVGLLVLGILCSLTEKEKKQLGVIPLRSTVSGREG